MNRKQGPPGTAWCGGHKRFLSDSAFTKDSSRWNGLDSQCAECRAKAREKAKNRRKRVSTKKYRGGTLKASKVRTSSSARTKRTKKGIHRF